ncbi:hypothetical protein JTB14_019893 [Gonioctena quinquepunctata]|nr:hypothetical protein JTB14_019893 [Gonioctena quinquepunctata]
MMSLSGRTHIFSHLTSKKYKDCLVYGEIVTIKLKYIQLEHVRTKDIGQVRIDPSCPLLHFRVCPDMPHDISVTSYCSTQPEIPREVLKNAVKKVISKSMSSRAAALRFNIPKSTSFDRVVTAKKCSNNNIEESANGGGESKEEFAPSKYASRQVFSRDEEIELEISLKRCSKICYGLTYELCRGLASQNVSKLNTKIPRIREINRKSGINWMQCFMMRHPMLSDRKPENTSIARASVFNRANVGEFFNNYAPVQATCNSSPDRKWNPDETLYPFHIPSSTDGHSRNRIKSYNSGDDDELNELLDDEKILKDDYLLVKFATKKRSLHYVGKVIDIMENGEFEVTFSKKCIKGFVSWGYFIY